MNTLKTTLLTTAILYLFSGCDASQTQKQVDTNTQEQAALALSPAESDMLAYMYNEEKLAREVYLNIYAVSGGNTLYNIATKAETQHVDMVKTTMENYNVFPSEYLELENAKYSFEVLQTLYDDLYTKGTASLQDAYEVGCMVEVTDIVDLDELSAKTSNETLLKLFSALKSASYKHYDAFDGALKGLGIIEGCCSLGNEYCF